MGIMKEFKDFAKRGNAVDMAVGIIIGGAFGKIVSSLVADIIMPPIGFLVGGVDFTQLSIVLREAVGDAAAVTLDYGNFIQTVFDFLIVAAAMFMTTKAMNSMRRREEKEPASVPESTEKPPVSIPEPTREEKLLTEIRDILLKK